MLQPTVIYCRAGSLRARKEFICVSNPSPLTISAPSARSRTSHSPPRGPSACFTVSRAEKEKNCYESRLYLLKDGAVRLLTGGGKESSFCYLDENTVLFAADREGEKEPSLSSRYYKIALDGGEAELAYTFPIPVSQVFPLPGGDLLRHRLNVPRL